MPIPARRVALKYLPQDRHCSLLYLVDLPGELLDEEERGSRGDPLPSVDTRVNEDYRQLEIWKH